MPEPETKAATCVKVALRCRPLLPKELTEGCQTCLACISGENQVVLGRDKAFTFDYAFGPSDPQSVVYEQAVLPLVNSLFKGFNATVLAYGQTGSGKTFTMGSSHDGCNGSGTTATSAIDAAASDETSVVPACTSGQQQQDLRGIIPRVIDELFANQAARSEEYEFNTRVSFLEIYNEELTDLLAQPRNAGGSGGSTEDLLAVREDLNGIKIVGLTEVLVTSAKQTLRLLEKGSQSRTTAATNMNATSSRSHAIFTVHIEKKKRIDAEDCCRAKFHLVDLAGSERAKRTGAEGSRFKEGVNINLGLLALGNVISALGDESSKRSHVPYRDSKLTRLLQDSLGGNSFTLMIACVSPADSNMEETLNTLRYADRARKIKNKPVVNRDPHTAELFRLRTEVQQLQAALSACGGAGIALIAGSGNVGSSASQCSGAGDNGIRSSSAAAVASALAEAKKWEQMYNEKVEENQRINAHLQSSIDHSTELCERLIMREHDIAKLKLRLKRLCCETGVTLTDLDVSLNDPSLAPELREKLLKVKDIQSRLAKLQDEGCAVDSSPDDEGDTAEEDEDEELAALRSSSSLAGAGDADGEVAVVAASSAAVQLSPSSGRGSADDDEGAGGSQGEPLHYSRSFELRRIKMSHELRKLNSLLCEKQALAAQMMGSEESSRRHLVDLEQQVARLQKERDALLDATQVCCSSTAQQQQQPRALPSAVGGCSSSTPAAADDGGCGAHAPEGQATNKLSEQRRQRLKELEAQLVELRKKIVDLSRVAKQKEQSDRRLQQLNTQITELKQQRVKLMRLMKDNSEAVRRYKQEKDKEVLQLKARDRKQQCEIARLEQRSRLTQAYYRRKAEEAATANKRLKDALDKQQKTQSEKRTGVETSHDLNSIGPRVKSYVNDEVEMQVSLRDAERHLQQLIADRRTLSEQLQQAREGAAAAKSHDGKDEDRIRQEQVRALEGEILVSNAQISDLQQKIVDAKGSKSVPVSDRVQTMVEAKCAIRYLVSLVIGSKLAESISMSRNAELNTTYEESAKQIQRLESEMLELQRFHANEIASLQREHEERTRSLVQQIGTRATAVGAETQSAARQPASQSSDDGEAASPAVAAQLRELVKMQADEIARLCTNESKLRRDVEQLRRALAVSRQKRGAASLLPSLDVHDSPYLKRREDSSSAAAADSDSPKKSFPVSKTTVTITATLPDSGDSDSGVRVVKASVVRKRAAAGAGDAEFDEDEDDELESSIDEDGGPDEYVDERDGSWHQDEEDLDPETPMRPTKKKKRSLASCGCTTGCSTMRCCCRKQQVSCAGRGCKCSADKCRNQTPADADSSKENQDPTSDAANESKDKRRAAGSRKAGVSTTLNSTFLLDSSSDRDSQRRGERKRSSAASSDAVVADAKPDVASTSGDPLASVGGAVKKRRLYNTAKQKLSAGTSFFEAPRV